jgi:DNA-binding SARP family transcriptional activator
MADLMDFGLLGPLLVRRGKELVGVPRGNQRAVLAALLLAAGRVVPVETLAELLWGPEPPASARATVKNYVKRLRQTLGETGRNQIRTHPGGYSITVAADELDVSRFESLVAAARAEARGRVWDRASQSAEAALALWRGEPLVDAGSVELAAQVMPRLAELHVQALEVWVGSELHLGRYIDVVPQLRQQLLVHPLREQLHALLMRALHLAGEQGEALAVYADARRILIGELGTEPGAELRELHQRILVNDPALAAPALVCAEPAAAEPLTAGLMADAPNVAMLAVPRQLPGIAGDFVGREVELAALDETLKEASGQQPGTVVINAISGTAGVGKTALAMRWAHQAASQFPDGQLYVNLRGFDLSSRPARSAEAIGGFLDALGVPAGRIPTDQAAQVGLYRSLLADRQILIVLDNAHDEEQVRPLLPPGPGCLTVVTSRNKMTGLAVAEGARLLVLDPLTPDEACRMLSARLGRHRPHGNPETIAEIARLCAFLPLALAAAAARAADSPALLLSGLAAELRASRPRLDALDALDAGDPAVCVRSVFSWSYRELSAGGQRMFRVMGLHPGPDIAIAAAASLAGTSPAETHHSLAELTRLHLVSEHIPGRYACHDLLRAYAAEQAATLDDEARGAATGRILDHYLHSAYAASRVLDPARDVQVNPALPRPPVVPEHFADPGQALAWLTAEHRVLLAAVRLAADNAFDTYAWQLPLAMMPFFSRTGHWHEQVAAQRTALAAAERLGDLGAQAISCRVLGLATAQLGIYDEARVCFSRAFGLYKQIGDRVGEACVHHDLCWLNGRHAV